MYLYAKVPVLKVPILLNTYHMIFLNHLLPFSIANLFVQGIKKVIQ